MTDDQILTIADKHKCWGIGSRRQDLIPFARGVLAAATAAQQPDQRDTEIEGLRSRADRLNRENIGLKMAVRVLRREADLPDLPDDADVPAAATATQPSIQISERADSDIRTLQPAATVEQQPQVDERAVFDRAMKESWGMVDALNPPGVPGSYARGEHNGICAALKTVRDNFDRLAAATAAQPQECGNCFDGKSDMDHACRKCGGTGVLGGPQGASHG